MERILNIDGAECRAAEIPLNGAKLLLIQTPEGFMLGCGYFSLETAEKLGHALAVVSGVSSWNDMLEAEVKGVSSCASDLGAKAGMTGREALRRMRQAQVRCAQSEKSGQNRTE